MKSSRHQMAAAGALVLTLLVLPGFVVAQQSQSKPDVRALRVEPNFYMIVGAGANVGVEIGEDGVVLVMSLRISSSV